MKEPKAIRAKFQCDSVTKSFSTTGMRDRFLYSYKFHAVYADTAENKAFWEFTPAGNIELTAVRDDLFQVGEEYYLDFTLYVPPPQPTAREMTLEEEEA